MHPAQPPPPVAFFAPHALDVGRKTQGQPSAFPSYLSCKGLTRSGLPASESGDPREGGSSATSSQLPASLGHSPLSPAFPPLHSLHPVEMSGWVCRIAARLRKPYAGLGSPVPAVAVADPRRRRRARVPCLRSGPAGRPGARGPRGQLQTPGSQAAPTWHGASWRFSPQLRRRAQPRGGFGGSQAVAGGGGPREPGVKVGGEPGAGLGWIINTLGGIRHAGSRPARARAPKSVPVKRRAGLKGGSVCGPRRGDDGGFFLRPRKRAERIIKAGKRSWEQRGGAWGGGFTRPGSCYSPRCRFPRRLLSIPQTAGHWDFPAPRASGTSELLEPLPGGACRSPAGPSLPAPQPLGPLQRVSPKQLPRKTTLLQRTWLAWDCL